MRFFNKSRKGGSKKHNNRKTRRNNRKTLIKRGKKIMGGDYHKISGENFLEKHKDKKIIFYLKTGDTYTYLGKYKKKSFFMVNPDDTAAFPMYIFENNNVETSNIENIYILLSKEEEEEDDNISPPPPSRE